MVGFKHSTLLWTLLTCSIETLQLRCLKFLLWTHGPTAVQEQYGKKEKRP